MKRIQRYILGVLTIYSIALTSCDAHRDFPDTGVKVGQILCTDGNVLTYEDYKTSGKEAIAVVFYVNNNEDIEGNGYAVYLKDLSAAAYTDTEDVNQGTSADITAYDGNSNTFALYSCSDASSPMAEGVFDIWRYGQSAYVPSVAQMRILYAAKASINPLIQKLGGDLLPDDSDEVWYWTSTEVEGQETAKAWLYSLGSGAIQETPKTQKHKVRPIITLNQ